MSDQLLLLILILQDKGGKKDNDEPSQEEKKDEPINDGTVTSRETKRQALLEKLHKDEIAVTYEAKRGGQHANARDINVGGVSVTFHGRPLIEETEIVINYGNRYGFIGPNGSGECCLILFSRGGDFFVLPSNFSLTKYLSFLYLYRKIDCLEGYRSACNSYPRIH
jgi:hypothetical protein